MSIANGTAQGRGRQQAPSPTTLPIQPGSGVAPKSSPAKGKRRASAGVRRVTVEAARWGNAWAYAGVVGTLAASAVLNGLAFAEHASSPWLAWGLGVAVPGFVLVFSRVAALAWARGERWLACAGGVATLALLLLSVQHLALSISRITGEHVALAALMALALDAGLVVCELFTLRR